MVNHFPIVLTLVGLGVALGALVTRRRVMWVYALATLALGGLSAIPAFLSGSQAGEVVEQRRGVSEAVVDAHEEAAEAALWVVLAMGLVSAYAWWRLTRRDAPGLPAPFLRALVLAAALAGSGAVGYAALLGGRIAHGPQSAAATAARSSSVQEGNAP
jgi:hypothetical protein